MMLVVFADSAASCARFVQRRLRGGLSPLLHRSPAALRARIVGFGVAAAIRPQTPEARLSNHEEPVIEKIKRVELIHADRVDISMLRAESARCGWLNQPRPGMNDSRRRYQESLNWLVWSKSGRRAPHFVVTKPGGALIGKASHLLSLRSPRACEA
jgi:hypothetical protein